MSVFLLEVVFTEEGLAFILYVCIVFMAAVAVFSSKEIVDLVRIFAGVTAVVFTLSASREYHARFFDVWSQLRWRWIVQSWFEEAVQQMRAERVLTDQERDQDEDEAHLMGEEALFR